MDSQQRKTPIPRWQYKAVLITAVVMLPMAACLFGLGLIDKSSNILETSAVVVVALALGIIVFALYKIRYKKETATAEARIVKRYKVKQKVEAGGGSSDPVGLMIEV
jgi:undecaprenyl pyrophosphate phosphatase UppP